MQNAKCRVQNDGGDKFQIYLTGSRQKRNTALAANAGLSYISPYVPSPSILAALSCIFCRQPEVQLYENYNIIDFVENLRFA